MIKVNHIREIYLIEEPNEGVMEVFADIKEDMDLLIAATAIYNELTFKVPIEKNIFRENCIILN